MLKPERPTEYPFPKSKPEARKGNFTEVQQPYTKEQAVLEADRCARCGDPVCIDVCPLQTNIRGMCDAVAMGDFKTAYHRIRETNALLGTTARCCPQLAELCESVCPVGSQGQPIAVGMIQRFVADWERNESRQPDPEVLEATGKSVAVVGGGPAGLAAAELLKRYGHSVTIYDELPVLGGTAWYGIPDYHLPKDVLQYEVDRIKGLGVAVKTGVRVGKDLTLQDLLSDHDAVLVTTGSKDVSKFDTPGSDLKGVYDGYRFLEDVFVNGVDSYTGNPTYELGRETLVIGGGDSALDCARTAIRLTQANVAIVYRRTEKEMPVDPILVEEGKEEGIQLKLLMAPKSYNGTDGRLTSVTMTVMKLGPVDASGRRSPEPTGEEVEMKCDSVIVAIGRGPNSFVQRQAGLKVQKKNAVMIDDHYRTSMKGVYAAGDVVTGESLVVKAMARGREAAQIIHEYVMNLEGQHVSLYDEYFTKRSTAQSYEDMLMGKEETLPPV